MKTESDKGVLSNSVEFSDVELLEFGSVSAIELGHAALSAKLTEYELSARQPMAKIGVCVLIKANELSLLESHGFNNDRPLAVVVAEFSSVLNDSDQLALAICNVPELSSELTYPKIDLFAGDIE